MRRRLALAALSLALLPGPGCFVVDELDSGLASMKGSKAEKQAEDEASPGDPPGARASVVPQKVKNLWRNARTPTSREAPADPGDAIVSCQIGGSVRFMSRTDCQTQGGSSR